MSLVTKADFRPKRRDICLPTDALANLEFTITDANGNAIDISSDDVKFTIKTAPGGACVVPTKTSTAGAHDDGPNGVVLFTVTKADISTASPTIDTCWWYEVTRCVGQDPLNEQVHIQGQYILSPRVGTC